jgi:hypothetical protein
MVQLSNPISIEDKALFDEHHKAHWTGDVNVIDPDLRERIKWLRTEGMTLVEIALHARASLETVRSVLDHEI